MHTERKYMTTMVATVFVRVIPVVRPELVKVVSYILCCCGPTVSSPLPARPAEGAEDLCTKPHTSRRDYGAASCS